MWPPVELERESMKTLESGWQNAEGIKFFVRGWEPDKRLKAVVILVHGLGEHTGRYARVGQAFAASGYSLVGFDLRGHGRSGGPRGHAPKYESLLDDLADFLAQMKVRYPKKPMFLYGHSLGGNLVLNFVLRRKPKVQGVIATAPWLEVAYELPAARVALARAINRILPAFSQASGLETAALSHDVRVVDAYVRDPLVHDRISVRLFSGMYESGLWASEHAADFPLPLLLMQGTADRLVSPRAARSFAERGGKKVTWRAWEGWYHEIHNEPQGARVLKMMIAWMDGRLRKK
jgi:alpha-beta hydrolase superfamily lysophospholipase